MKPDPVFHSVPTEVEIEAAKALDMPGGCFCVSGEDGQFSFIWTEESEARTGRDLWDLFDRPGPSIQYGDLLLNGEHFTSLFAAFAREFPEAPLPPTSERTAERYEWELRALWERLWSQPEAPLPLIAAVLMVLVVGTELHLCPYYSTHVFEDGTERQIEWRGERDLHQRTNGLWQRILSGAPGADLLEEYDALCSSFPVPPPLASCQKSLLAGALGEREHLLRQAKQAEAGWLRSNVDLLAETESTVAATLDSINWRDLPLKPARRGSHKSHNGDSIGLAMLAAKAELGRGFFDHFHKWYAEGAGCSIARSTADGQALRIDGELSKGDAAAPGLVKTARQLGLL